MTVFEYVSQGVELATPWAICTIAGSRMEVGGVIGQKGMACGKLEGCSLESLGSSRQHSFGKRVQLNARRVQEDRVVAVVVIGGYEVCFPLMEHVSFRGEAGGGVCGKINGMVELVVLEGREPIVPYGLARPLPGERGPKACDVSEGESVR